MNCELKDAQGDSDLSVTEHPSDRDPDIQQHEVSSNDNDISRENESDRSTIVPSDDQTHELETEDIYPTLTAGRLPTTGNKIEYKLSNSSTWHAALVLGRASKATGKNKYWINIKNLSDNTLQSLNLEELTSWKNMDEEVLLNSATSDTVEVLSAKKKELDNWRRYNVYTEVPDKGQQCVSVRWVSTEKMGKDRPVNKARLVARGFEEENLNEIRKDSPTCSKENLRIVLAIILSYQWQASNLHVKSAFFQGNQIDRDLYLKPLKEADTGNFWKLKTTVYQLSDASRVW